MSFSSFVGRSQFRGDLIALSNKARKVKEEKITQEKKIFRISQEPMQYVSGGQNK